MYGFLLLLHILAATIWTGGHIVLCFVVLPKVLKHNSPELLLEFESAFEKVGMPALLLQVASGLSLAYLLLPAPTLWFALDNPVSRLIALKLSLLILTACLALNARFRVIPYLSQTNLVLMAWHIRAVTLLSIFFVAAGVSLRSGWL